MAAVAELRTAGCALGVRTERHQKATWEFGEETVVLSKCRSDRAAFAVVVEQPLPGDRGAPVRTEWSHTYCAMGLPKQHAWQQTILARIRNVDVAACFLKAVVRILGAGFYRSLVSFGGGRTNNSRNSSGTPWLCRTCK